MGVPALFRWLSKKYPKIVSSVEEEDDMTVPDAEGNPMMVPVNMGSPNPNGVEFDNLYLDMNGIVHPCTHPEGKPAPETEEEMMVEVFKYTERVVNMIRPRKLLFMAIDGVAPRAKMNQQRSRRFRAAQEAKEKEEAHAKAIVEWEAMGKTITDDDRNKKGWDSNAITPGTPFMHLLAASLRYWVVQKINTDSGWKGVIISDAGVPGEGEHKIMDYIRRQRLENDYDPNTCHVIYGLDADLIMLALATHEPHFRVLREDVFANDKSPTACRKCGQEGHYAAQCTGAPAEIQKKPTPEKKPFIFLDVSILREYLEVELNVPGAPFSFEQAIDDWVLLIFFVGNDFLPHLPSLEIREGAIDTLMKIWKRELPRMGGYLTNNGHIELSRAQIILEGLAQREDEIFRKRREAEEHQDQRAKRRKLESGEAKPSDFSNGPSLALGLTGPILSKSSANGPTNDLASNAVGVPLPVAKPNAQAGGQQQQQQQQQMGAMSNRDIVANRAAIRLANMNAAESLKAELAGLQPLKTSKNASLSTSSNSNASATVTISNDNVTATTTNDTANNNANGSTISPITTIGEEGDEDEDGIPGFGARKKSDATVANANAASAATENDATAAAPDTEAAAAAAALFLGDAVSHPTTTGAAMDVDLATATNGSAGGEHEVPVSAGMKRKLGEGVDEDAEGEDEDVVTIDDDDDEEGGAISTIKIKGPTPEGGENDAMDVGADGAAANTSGPEENEQDEKSGRPELKFKVNSDGTVEQEDTVKLWEPGYRERYYRSKFGVEYSDEEFKQQVTKCYIEGLCWVLHYYYQGTPSWQWYYPFHFAPFAADFNEISKLDLKFETGQPFKPYEQLMGVFPAASRQHIPKPFHPLMCDEDSPILDFYPSTFEIDMNGKRMAWQGVALLPFIDEKRLLDAMGKHYPDLTEEEIERNNPGNDMIFASSEHAIYPFYESLYGKKKLAELLKTNEEEGNKRPGVPMDYKKAKVSGFVLPNLERIPGSTYKCPIPTQGLPDIKNDQSLSMIYYMPEPAPGMVHRSVLLPGLKKPARVLSAADLEQTRQGGGGRGRGRGGPGGGGRWDSSAGFHHQMQDGIGGGRGGRGGRGYSNNHGGDGGYDRSRNDPFHGRHNNYNSSSSYGGGGGGGGGGDRSYGGRGPGGGGYGGDGGPRNDGGYGGGRGSRSGGGGGGGYNSYDSRGPPSSPYGGGGGGGGGYGGHGGGRSGSAASSVSSGYGGGNGGRGGGRGRRGGGGGGSGPSRGGGGGGYNPPSYGGPPPPQASLYGGTGGGYGGYGAGGPSPPRAGGGYGGRGGPPSKTDSDHFMAGPRTTPGQHSQVSHHAIEPIANIHSGYGGLPPAPSAYGTPSSLPPIPAPYGGYGGPPPSLPPTGTYGGGGGGGGYGGYGAAGAPPAHGGYQPPPPPPNRGGNPLARGRGRSW